MASKYRQVLLDHGITVDHMRGELGPVVHLQYLTTGDRPPRTAAAGPEERTAEWPDPTPLVEQCPESSPVQESASCRFEFLSH